MSHYDCKRCGQQPDKCDCSPMKGTDMHPTQAPTKFRKKPVVIDAVQFDGTLRSIEAMNIPAVSQELGSKDCQIETLEGTMTAQPGDWIIKGVKGEFYPCKPDVFAATYEPALSSPSSTVPNSRDRGAERLLELGLQPVSDLEWTANTLESVALWMAGRTKTVWAEESGYSRLMESWAEDLRTIRAALTAPAPSAAEPVALTDDPFEAWKQGRAVQYFQLLGYDSEWTDYTLTTPPEPQPGRLQWRVKP